MSRTWKTRRLDLRLSDPRDTTAPFDHRLRLCSKWCSWCHPKPPGRSSIKQKSMKYESEAEGE